jgi:hypothetical protein
MFKISKFDFSLWYNGIDNLGVECYVKSILYFIDSLMFSDNTVQIRFGSAY